MKISISFVSFVSFEKEEEKRPAELALDRLKLENPLR